MVNKKGWIRIVEASIAILIIFSVLVVVSRTSVPDQSTDLSKQITPMLEEIARNVTLREEIVSKSTSESIPILQAFVSKRVKPVTIKHDVAICAVDQICSLASYPKDATNLYAGERVISSTLNNFSPKKVKIFLWRPEA